MKEEFATTITTPSKEKASEKGACETDYNDKGRISGPLKVRIVEREEDFFALKDLWNGLLKESATESVYLRHEWMTAWWRAFGYSSRMQVMVFSDRSGRPVAIAPLMLTQTKYRGIPAGKLCFMLNGYSPAGDIIARRGWTAPVVEALLDEVLRIRGWDVLSLERLDECGETYKAIKEKSLERGLSYGTRMCIKTPYIRIKGSWEDFFGKRSTRFRKSMRNKLNRASKKDIKIFGRSLGSSKDGLFREILSISGESWKREVRGDLNSNRESYIFLKTITELLGPQGVVSVWILEHNGRAVAFEYHITYNGTVYPLRADFNRRFRNLSPGSILEYYILKDLFDTGRADEYNTCGFVYQYLMNWTDDSRTFMGIDIFRPSNLGRLLFILKYKAVPLAKRAISFVRRTSVNGNGAFNGNR